MDANKKECPNCHQLVFHTAPICKHCKYDFDKKRAPKAPKEPKIAKVTKTPEPDPQVEDTVVTAESLPSGSGRQHLHSGSIIVPALGRMNGADIDHNWLHFRQSVVNDDTLLAWAINVREHWQAEYSECLSNHAIGYLAKILYWPGHAESKRRNLSDKVLYDNREHIVTLLGGDDWL
jgi:hypothetical protein